MCRQKEISIVMGEIRIKIIEITGIKREIEIEIQIMMITIEFRN